MRQLKEGPARFPESWHVSSALLEHFCHVTRQHLVEVLGESHHSVDPQLLIKALHKSAPRAHVHCRGRSSSRLSSH